MTIRLLIAEDHEAVLEGLRVLFDGSEVEIAAEARTARETLQLALRGLFDVVLLDLWFPDGSGFELLQRIKREKPTLPVLIHSNCDNRSYVNRGRALGAHGYLLKGDHGLHLVNAVRSAARGEMFWGDEPQPDATTRVSRSASTAHAIASERTEDEPAASQPNPCQMTSSLASPVEVTPTGLASPNWSIDSRDL